MNILPGSIYVDIHEPADASPFIAPTVPCEVDILNERGYADYCWRAIDGQLVQVERKQWPELMGKVDAVEDQLRRHMKSQPEARLMLVVEGLPVPVMGGVSVLRSTNKDRVFVLGYNSSISYSQIMAWLYQINKYIEVYLTSTYKATCIALTAFYKADQKPEHSTFQRHFKEVTFHPNPQVIQVMGLFPGIGEKKAEALVERFTTVYNIISASPSQLATVPGIGAKLSRTILQRIGRPDV